MVKYVFIAFVLFFTFSCKKDNSAPINLGYHYFPINEGHFVVYDVVSIVHDDIVAVHDTNVYQIKEVIGETYVDLEGENFQKLYRYKRAYVTENWQIKDVWTIKLKGQTAEVVEENKRRIKMGFAISYEKQWDGNALNEDDTEECYYSKITEPFTVNNGDIIDSTAIVEHTNFVTFIDYTRRYEVYAANIGKIYSYIKDFTITNSDISNPIKGVEQYYSMIEYGEE